jgi:hypothetical protein
MEQDLAVQKAKFEGQCKDLEDQLYDICGAQQANQFMKTAEEIGLYVGQQYSGDIRDVLRKEYSLVLTLNLE